MKIHKKSRCRRPRHDTPPLPQPSPHTFTPSPFTQKRQRQRQRQQPTMVATTRSMAQKVPKEQEQEKSRILGKDAELRILRQARERAAEGQCIICLENKPNIATLCCGQAVHIHCIAEWLANNGTSCVNCRAPLPSMNHRQTQPPQRQHPNEQDDDGLFDEEEEGSDPDGLFDD